MSVAHVRRICPPCMADMFTSVAPHRPNPPIIFLHCFLCIEKVHVDGNVGYSGGRDGISTSIAPSCLSRPIDCGRLSLYELKQNLSGI